MENLVTFALTVFTGFFAISNPIANTPIFLGLVDGKDAQTKKNIAKKGTMVAFIIVAVFVLLGKYIFELFDITIPAFKIAGGILIFYVGFEMLMSQKSKVQTNNTEDDSNNLAVSPLAIPIISGPGTIVTAMNFTTNATYTHIAIVILMFAFIIFLNYICFILSNKIVQLVGPNLITVLGKIMGLILAIIGTGMLIAGIKIAFNL
jgi:multiple antibiotic resistance protein